MENGLTKHKINTCTGVNFLFRKPWHTYVYTYVICSIAYMILWWEMLLCLLLPVCVHHVPFSGVCVCVC